MRSGVCWERPKLSELPTFESVFGLLLPTPTASRYGSRNNGQRGDGTTYKTAGSLSLRAMAYRGLWPTGEPPRGKLNPPWVEWLMGWPIGWTDLEPLETGRYREWLRLHGGF